MMKFKKTSVSALIIALILMMGVSAAFATTAAPGTASGAADTELAQRQAQWESNLAPYSPFGLTCAYDSASDCFRMYYQGVEVCGLWDEARQIWITDHAGNGHAVHGNSAPELHAVYTNGYLTGLRFATEEEQAEWTALREKNTAEGTMGQEATEGWQGAQAAEPTQLSPEEMMALYGPYGISYDAQGNLLYKGEMVRFFCDGVGTEDGGWFVRHDFFNKDGTVDVYTQRACVDNGDGSVNPFGPLTGLRRATYDEFKNLNLITTTDDAVVEEAVADVFTLTEGGHHSRHHGDTRVVADTFACGNSASGQSLADRFGCYAEYGVVFDGNGLGSVSFCGEPVGKFVDIQPDGGVFTYTAPDGDGLCVCTVYDKNGVLVGVEVVEGG